MIKLVLFFLPTFFEPLKTTSTANLYSEMNKASNLPRKKRDHLLIQYSVE